ncbi:MAG TPA: DUF2213 domain-containing protein [Candidatus Ventrousia excrementavium]|uniref:DUF2213 domain-containing protein n=1 Tax=Candidatus Ventrousia excrementavium TaxID=2840961 RepID=A0A9D1IXF9_9CLOT|nr:DUF2213 domain-containing protein [Candidatus Ventrousia excrementavium]
MPIAYYGTDISPNKTETVEGYLVCRNVPIARTGAQEYTARELMLDGDPERPVVVDRRPEDVFEPAVLASFEGKPVTDGHPPENVGPENYAAYSRGHVQNVRREGDYIVADLYINDKALASDIQNGVKREVSCGYTCNYVPDGAGYRQERIRGNHVAVVPRGRAGHEVAIQDHAAEQAEKGLKRMKKETKEALYRFFGLAANDAAPEELEQLTKDVATVAGALDAEPAEQAQEAEPAKDAEDEMVIKAPKGDDIGSKLDRILEMLAARSRGGEGEHRLHDETDLDEMIDRLAGKEDGKALTIPVENEDCAAGPARDAAVELLRKVRPAVAGIKDKSERARVTDALLSIVRGNDMTQTIASAALDSAKANADKTRQTTYEQICTDSANAYAERNPHTKKEC